MTATAERLGRRIETPQRIPKDLLVKQARAELSQFLPQVSPKQKMPRQEWIEKFVTEKVTGIRLHGVDVISIDVGDHKTTDPLPPVAQAYLRADRTKLIVAQYFEPELRRNGVYRTLEPIKSLVNYGRSLAGREVHRPWYEYPGQLGTAKRVEEVVRDLGKPVAVADVANKNSYIIAENMLQFSPTLLGLPFGLPGVAVAGFASLLWMAGMRGQQQEGKGVADKEKVGTLDRSIVDFTQARRLYLAKGIEMLTQEYQPKAGEQTPRIVVLYPKAHTMRMEDILFRPQPTLNFIRSGIYKSFFWLNFSVRKWEYQKPRGEKKSTPQKGSWVRTSRERISM